MCPLTNQSEVDNVTSQWEGDNSWKLDCQVQMRTLLSGTGIVGFMPLELFKLIVK